MSALVLSKKTEHKRNFSDKMMDFFQRLYRPIIERAIHKKMLVVVLASGLFIISLFTFFNMGGEFIPQLDEGDFAVETRVPVGSSINQMIDVSQKAQTILLSQYDSEVSQVVHKIGSGEIPTDPMPIEAGDMMVILKPKDGWTNAENREELIEKTQSSLSVIPNATFSFQQPIQMRFNELLTGAKQDVVIKIYGEDLNILSDLAGAVGNKIKSVDGVEDLYVEEITGLPQILIQLNRDKIAQYGLNVQNINTTIKTGFAGQAAGMVFEGERRFDLVVRLAEKNRSSIEDVQNLYIDTPNGNQIPLREVANISFEPGPVQIQRDDAKRRVTIGFNVRNRDVQSIVNDIKNIVGDKVTMPAGYYVTYGGQFQNLQEANQRLMIALPIALLLILVLLYFTFKSFKQSLLIFTAIPLSAIGGVFALLIRDMPFSISAGIGFIALFGVAVLNGIVLIAEFNRLQKAGVTDIYQRVLEGTKVRLRPVLMTATVASFGFLPMAISSSSGAEVQRPLATVVIGGLITATALTLIVLPVLYIYFTEGKMKIKLKKKQVITSVLVLAAILLPLNNIQAQETPINKQRTLNLQQAIQEALNNNDRIKIAKYEVDVAETGKLGAINIPKTELSYDIGNLNNPEIQDNNFGIQQRINFPTLYTSQFKLAKAKILSQEQLKIMEENRLIGEVKMAYLNYLYVLHKNKLLAKQDSLYSNLNKSSLSRYKSGESTKLESVTSTTQAMQVKNKLLQNQADLQIAKKQLQTLLNTKDDIAIVENEMQPLVLEIIIQPELVKQSPLLAYLNQETKVSQQETKVQKNGLLPDLIFGYNSQTFVGQNLNSQTLTKSDRFSFFQAGIAIPILPGGKRTKIKEARLNESISQSQLELTKTTLLGELENLYQEYLKHQSTLRYYQDEALPQANLIIKNSEKSFKGGDVSYTQYLQNLTLATTIQTEYLNTLWQYNQSIITIKTVIGLP